MAPPTFLFRNDPGCLTGRRADDLVSPKTTGCLRAYCRARTQLWVSGQDSEELLSESTRERGALTRGYRKGGIVVSVQEALVPTEVHRYVTVLLF